MSSSVDAGTYCTRYAYLLLTWHDVGAKDLADVSSWIHAQYLDFLAVLIKALGHSTSDPIQV